MLAAKLQESIKKHFRLAPMIQFTGFYVADSKPVSLSHLRGLADAILRDGHIRIAESGSFH